MITSPAGSIFDFQTPLLYRLSWKKRTPPANLSSEIRFSSIIASKCDGAAWHLTFGMLDDHDSGLARLPYMDQTLHIMDLARAHGLRPIR